MYFLSLTTCTHYTAHHCSIKDPCVISSRTTTFHHCLLCVHMLHFLHLHPPHLPPESSVCVHLAFFSIGWTPSWIHAATHQRTPLSTSSQQTMKAHLLVSVPIFSAVYPPSNVQSQECWLLRVSATQCWTLLTWCNTPGFTWEIIHSIGQTTGAGVRDHT